MRASLSQLHERLGVTTVYVTHDQVEAMTLGQRVCVLREGRLQQAGPPQALFRAPVNLFVAEPGPARPAGRARGRHIQPAVLRSGERAVDRPRPG
jgi:ABC-type sugar transport system ATPase subunit